jgi:hypothetical protein
LAFGRASVVIKSVAIVAFFAFFEAAVAAHPSTLVVAALISGFTLFKFADDLVATLKLACG